MTELSFLINLLMNHKLQKVTKDLIAERITEVEANFNAKHPMPVNTTGVAQAPSTLALLEKHGALPPGEGAPIAQTAATAAAMASRQQAIAQQLSGKPEKGATSPRKW